MPRKRSRPAMRYFGRWAGILVAMYVASYVVLSLLGSYGFWWVSGTGPKYMWYPRGCGSSDWKERIVGAFYTPLWTVDHYLWHTPQRRRSGAYPSVDEWP